MTIAVASILRSGRSLSSSPRDAAGLRDLFRRRTAECLAVSNYTTPGTYKVETLMLHIWVEIFRMADMDGALTFVLASTVKLAFRMGYHRDPKYFPRISAMEGEMRRRTWALLCQMDTLMSFQVGLPRSILQWHYDTEPPRNISDEEFDEQTDMLPPAWPEFHATTVSYLRAKLRVMEVFGTITDIAFSQKESVPYGRILELDKKLEKAHELIPPFLRARPLEESIGTSMEIVTRRFTLETW